MSDEGRRGDWIQTFMGVKFYPLDPRPEEIFLRDIAHALSLQCRFAGHVRWHMSIAQHSVLVCKAVARQNPRRMDLIRWALLHDATEAYLVDLPSPVKRLMPEYSIAEDELMAVVAERFGLELPPMPPEVKLADLTSLSTERRDLLPEEPPWGDNLPPPWPKRLERWTWEHAESTFLAMAQKIKLKELW